jgi:hypothetical protein
MPGLTKRTYGESHEVGIALRENVPPPRNTSVLTACERVCEAAKDSTSAHFIEVESQQTNHLRLGLLAATGRSDYPANLRDSAKSGLGPQVTTA